MIDYKELKIRDLEFKYQKNDKETFIRNYGAFNCKYLTFKNHNDIINELQKADPTPLSNEQKKFLVKNSNKEVLCYILHPDKNTDIFVFGDDNIPFNTNCFV